MDISRRLIIGKTDNETLIPGLIKNYLKFLENIEKIVDPFEKEKKENWLKNL